MKRRALALFTALILLLLLRGDHAAAARTVTIRLGSVVPVGSIWDQALQSLGDDWQRGTGGEVKLIVFAGGRQGDDPTLIRKMRLNQLQGAALTLAGLGQIDPAFDVFGIPFFVESHAELVHVRSALEPDLKRRLKARGFELLSWGHAGTVRIFSKNPVRSIDDLRATRLFAMTGNPELTRWYQSNGFNPVPLALSDVAASVQTGMVDAVPSTPLAALAFQWYRHAPHMLDLDLAQAVGATVITQKAWRSISEKHRAVLLQASAAMERRLDEEIPRQERAAIEAMTKRGLSLTKPGPQVEAEWRTEVERLVRTTRGTIVPSDAFDSAMRARSEFRSREAGGETER